MTEDDLLELGFERVEMPIEETGNKEDYYFFQFILKNNEPLLSSSSDESGKRNWFVTLDGWGKLTEIEDIELMIKLFEKMAK